MQPVAIRELLRAATRGAGIALGGAPLGNLVAAVGDEPAVATVERAWGLGVRYYDTAPHYGQGLSEQRLGKVLSRKPRAELLLSTKVGRLLRPDAQAPASQHGYVAVPPLATVYDYSRGGVMRSLEASRERLRLSRIDIVYVHDLDVATHGDQFARHWRDFLRSGLSALAELKRSGDIAGFGIGVNGVEIALATLCETDLDAILLAGRYTLADQSALAQLLPLCEARGVAVVAGGPFNSGILATGAHPADGAPAYFDYAPAPPGIVAKVEALESVCTRHGVPLRAAAMQFPSTHPAVATVLPGARSVAEVDDLVAMRRQPIPAGFWVELRERGLIAPDAPLPSNTHL